jgi:5-methylcytosine-specific restriction protein A
MPLREHLGFLMDNFPEARAEPFKGHPLAQRIADDLSDAVEDAIDDPSYKVTGSAGKGGWAHTIWLGVFDRLITESAQRGFYLVYLIPSDGKRIFLSLNQGTEEIYARVGKRHLRRVLEDTATRDRGLLEGEETYGLRGGPLSLGATYRRTEAYESGNIFAVEYGSELPPEADLEADLTRLLLLYRSLAEARDQVQEDERIGPSSPAQDRPEAARYRWHKRAERSRKLAKEAKRFHGTRCQVPACGKDLFEIYGELAEGYIEAHHLIPFASLEGRPTDLNPKTDFAVVCPDCHRMIHRRPEPYTLEEISARILTQPS